MNRIYLFSLVSMAKTALFLSCLLQATAGGALAGASLPGPSPRPSIEAKADGAGLEVAFACLPSIPTVGNPVQFLDKSEGAPVSWRWEFGDGATSTDQNPVHVYAAAGFRKVSLVASDGTTTKTYARTITVQPLSWTTPAESSVALPDSQPLVARIVTANAGDLRVSFTCSPRIPTVGHSVQFSDSSKGDPIAWLWEFEDGTSSTLQNPVHTFMAAGFQKVTLVATDGPTTKRITRTITIQPESSAASFTYTPVTPGPGETVQFTDTTTGDPTSWLWEFGDGGTSTSRNPTHVYQKESFYTVTLTASNSYGSKRATRMITVASMSALNASFVYSPNFPPAGQPVQFTDTTTGSPSAWLWDFGDGETSTTQNPSHIFAEAGLTTVTLTASNASGSNTATKTVTVVIPLAASFTYTPSSPLAGQSIQFTDTSTGAPTSWLWTFGDGATSTLRNPSHIYTTAGTKTVTLTVSAGSGTSTATRTLTVGTTLAASFTYAPALPEAGESVQFTDTSAGTPSTWQWNFADGTGSNVRNPAHIFATAGSFPVTLTVVNASGQSTTTRVVTVVPSPVLAASFTFSPVSPAPAQTVQFLDSSTGTPTSWLWNFGDGTTSAAQNPGHAFQAEGTYAVVLIVANASGSATATRSVTVATRSDVIPNDRLYDWSFAGVPGGIPNRATIFRTLTPANSLADINAAIAACPPGQVVYLSAGTYTIGQITFGYKSGVTLRGAGPGRTVINTTATYAIGNSCYSFNETDGIPLANDGSFRKDSRSITLAAAPSANFVVGCLVAITQDNAPTALNGTYGVYSRDGSTNRIYNLSATRSYGYVTRITSVVGNVIGLAGPIPIDYTYALNVKAYPLNGPSVMSLCGVENLTVNGGDRAINWWAADRCWVKNVEANRTIGTNGAIFLANSVQCEVRRCYIHDTPYYPYNQDGYGITLYHGTSNCLVVDNIGARTAQTIMMNGACGNAILYNYAQSVGRAGELWVQPGILSNHGPHGAMNLFEGNMVPLFQNDGYHGSTSHQVLFRNQIHGTDPSGKTYNRRLVDLCRGSYYHSVVGNIIGDPSWMPLFYDLIGSPDSSACGCMYILGYPNMGNQSLVEAVSWTGWTGTYPDRGVTATLLRHGNYDYFHRDVVWDPGITTRTLPASLFYSAKPDFFGSLQWPPIGPDVGGFVTAIPARSRWIAYAGSGIIDDLFRD